MFGGVHCARPTVRAISAAETTYTTGGCCKAAARWRRWAVVGRGSLTPPVCPTASQPADRLTTGDSVSILVGRAERAPPLRTILDTRFYRPAECRGKRHKPKIRMANAMRFIEWSFVRRFWMWSFPRQCSILQFGNACSNFFTPSSLTSVFWRCNSWRLVNALRCSRLASVTWEPDRCSDWSWVSALR